MAVGSNRPSTAEQETLLAELQATLDEHDMHFHNWSVVGGAAAAPSGETHVCDWDYEMATIAPFQIDAGADTWGAWTLIIGSDDTPARVGNTEFDFRHITIEDVERDGATTMLQIGHGDPVSQIFIQQQLSTRIFVPKKDVKHNPLEIMTKRITAGEKVWARLWVKGQNTGTMDFYIDVHEYP